MPIALLKFPTDLLGEVFKLCNPLELYCLSKCSKRVRKSIILRRSTNWKIRYGESKTIWVHCGKDGYVFRPTRNPDECYKTALWPHRLSCPSMFVDIDESGDSNLFTYLLDTFKITIVKSMNNVDQEIDFLRQTAIIAIDRNMEVERVTLYYSGNTRDVVDFMPILVQMNISQKFSCFLDVPSNFQLITYPYKISISNSIWFNIGQLLDCNCVQIELYDSMLRNEDLDVFLGKWMKKGAFPNLRWLEVQSKNINERYPILEMIPPIRIVNNPLIETSLGKKYRFKIFEAIRVIKDDGTEGWLKVELGEWPTLKFLVVNPGSGNVTRS